MIWVYRSAIILVITVTGIGLSAFASWQGWLTSERSHDALAQQLRPHMRIFKPEGDGPFPTILQFHGCGSAVASQDEWAAFFAGNGYAALVVDSLAPRGIGREEAITTVCTGLQLTSLERAGDILASLELARELEFVDTENVFLAGWSHGGWSIMDLLTFDLGQETPPNLQQTSPDELDGIRGAVLIYPYCGFPARSASQDWQKPLSTIAIMGARDIVAPAHQCQPIFDRLGGSGVEIEANLFADATHAFDLSGQERYQGGDYNESATMMARDQVLSFLDTHSNQ